MFCLVTYRPLLRKIKTRKEKGTQEVAIRPFEHSHSIGSDTAVGSVKNIEDSER
jgi:hypothetical protein